MTTRRTTIADLHAVQLDLARAQAENVVLARTNERLLAALTAAAPGAGAAVRVPVPLADAPPVEGPTLPPELVALCKRFDDGSPRQYATNLRVARGMLADGKTPQEISRALLRGESVTP